jgi:hypothetical protein
LVGAKETLRHALSVDAGNAADDGGADDAIGRGEWAQGGGMGSPGRVGTVTPATSSGHGDDGDDDDDDDDDDDNEDGGDDDAETVWRWCCSLSQLPAATVATAAVAAAERSVTRRKADMSAKV